MKIRKVKIDSFRLFDDEEIVFVNPRQPENCANLVAVHAPNGFGKTSLFDAIEFCVTNNIQRLKTVTFKEDLKSDKAENCFSSFIHNKENPDKEVAIKILFEDGSDKERRVKPDEEMRLLKGDAENGYFSDVMLSQDWFSRFLSATDAAQRFEMFTKNFKDTEGLLEYYEQLKMAKNVIAKKIAQKKQELNDEKKKLNGDVDAQIVEHLYEAIKQLADTGIVIDWSGTIGDKQIENLALQGDQRRFDVERELGNANAIVDSIERVKDGQDGLIAADRISDVMVRIGELSIFIQEYQQQLKKISILKSLSATIDALKTEVAKYIMANNELDYLIKQYPAYKEITEKTALIIKRRESIDKELEYLSEKMSSKEQELKVAEELFGNLAKERDDWQNKKDTLKEDYVTYQLLLSQIKQMSEKEQNVGQSVAQHTQKIELLEKERQRLLEMYTTVLQSGVTVVLDEYKKASGRILALGQAIKEMNDTVRRLELSISEQQAYMGQVDALVVSAREMSVTLKLGVCPLCGYDYGRVDSLLEAIEGNHSISESIEEAIRQKSETERTIEKAKKERDDNYRQLVEKIGERICAIDTNIRDALATKQEKETILAVVRFKRQMLQEKIATEYSDFENRTEAQVAAIYSDQLILAEQKVEVMDKNRKSLSKELQKSHHHHQNLMLDRDVRNKELLESQKKPEYLEYSYKLQERNESQTSLALWKQQQVENDKVIVDFNGKIVAAGKEKTKMENEGVSLSQEVLLTEQMDALSTEKNALDSLLFNTIQFIRNDCKLQMVDKDTPPEVIMNYLDDAKVKSQNRVKVVEGQKKLLGSFKNLLTMAEQYNVEQKVKKKIYDLEKQIGRREKQKEEIEEETGKLKTFLDDFVQSYFQLDLINKLYNTIDPHPNYKKVHFKCDFEQKKPRLNVVMESVTDGNDKIVPNLYLSTAQISILSFCIFMAKAVFAQTNDGKNLDCIFVDDPIQALDDINILSMIDLMRNVAFTLNKQIVITTHDRNFFQLLQKKMPQDKFNACYLCLKERGKFSVVEYN